MAHRNTILTAEEVAARIATAHGYTLCGPWLGQKRKHEFSCPLHGETHETDGRTILNGGLLKCCYTERRREVGRSLVGEKNPFFGKRHTIEYRIRVSALRKAALNHFRGKPRPDRLKKITSEALQGRVRSDETRAKLSAHQLKVQGSVDHIAQKSARGMTAGKPGFVYFVRICGLVKIGSTTRTLDYRLTRLKREHGEADLLLATYVADCGAFEATLQLHHRSAWVRGEFFNLAEAFQ